MPRSQARRRAPRGLLAAVLLAACSFNPATGRLQLTTVSESEEIALGKENDVQVVEALGLYEDDRLSELVTEVGGKLAAKSERPGLPWTFRVLDDPTVNAFALPGGWVYVTRGLLVHLSSSDELAAVLGHEIGHVTARHGVVQLRKTKVAAASVGVFRIIDPNLRHVGGIAAGTAGLALLKHGRDDEYEADELGVRYAGRAGYSSAATVGVFDVLVRVSRAEPGGRVPTWLSTHPDPELRRARVQRMVSGTAPQADLAYTAAIDGVVYGDDPRDGFLVETTYVHPRSGFAIDLPAGWKALHDGPIAMAVAPDEAALFVLAPIEAETAAAALEQFFSDGAMRRGEQWDGKVGGFPVASAGFSAATSSGDRSGLVAFVDYDDQVLMLAAMGPTTGWSERLEAVALTFASFRRAPRALANVEPMRVRPYVLPAATSLETLQEAKPSSVDLARLGLLNGIDDPKAELPEGTVVKRVEGGLPAVTPESAAPSRPPEARTPG